MSDSQHVSADEVGPVPFASAQEQSLHAEIERLRAENAALSASTPKAGGKVSFKVSSKKGVSAYGLNVRFPVTLYKEQWLRLLAQADELRAFIQKHESELAVKAPRQGEAAPDAE